MRCSGQHIASPLPSLSHAYSTVHTPSRRQTINVQIACHMGLEASGETSTAPGISPNARPSSQIHVNGGV